MIKPVKDPSVKNPNAGLKVLEKGSMLVGRTYSQNRHWEGKVYVHFEIAPGTEKYAETGRWVALDQIVVLEKLGLVINK